jgi:threonine dehydrogenase-like Zn-dependent dehydrogenase
MGFQGVLGHEFVGVVESVNSSGGGDGEDSSCSQSWVGKRVCGDINLPCRKADCAVCSGPDASLARNHCPNRTVLGILNKHGTYAQYLTLPVTNLHELPDSAGISDEHACFAEPLAAACRIVEQRLVPAAGSSGKVCVLGDGKLGLLISEVVGRHCSCNGLPKPTLVGRHAENLSLVETLVNTTQDASSAGSFDVVVDATGNPTGLQTACGMCKPMGTVVLKSTCSPESIKAAAAANPFDGAPIVINEISVVGSRCGPFPPAIELLSSSNEGGPVNVGNYLTASFPLSEVEKALELAQTKGTKKVQLVMWPE